MSANTKTLTNAIIWCGFFLIEYNIGGGIVYDSDPYDEWVETMNKLRANMTCLIEAEQRHARLQSEGGVAAEKKEMEVRESKEEEQRNLVHPGGGL